MSQSRLSSTVIALTLASACFLLSGCGSTTVREVAVCPKPFKPDPRLMEAPTEFEPLPEGSLSEAQALDTVTNNNLSGEYARQVLKELQRAIRDHEVK